MKSRSFDVDQHPALEQSIKGVLVIQIIATLIVLFGVTAYSFLFIGNHLWWWDRLAASSYGAALAITGTILSARSMRRAGHTASAENRAPGQFSMVPIFSGVLNKLVIVGGGIGFGLIVGLNPNFVVATYLLVQIAASARLILSDN